MDTKALRQKILDLAIRGKLVPQDPNDEPASVLLERIRQQKQQMVKEGKLKPKDIKNDSVIFVGEDNLHYEKFANGSVKCIEDEIPFDLPDGWAWSRLTSICSLISDIDHKMPKAVDDGVLFLSAKDLLDDGTINYTDDVKMISEEDFLRLSRKALPQKNDIVYSRIGACLGKARVVTKDIRFIVSYSCCTIRPVIIDSTFLALILDGDFVLDQAKEGTQSVGVPDLGMTSIKQFLIPIPPLVEQQRIDKRLQYALNIVQQISAGRDDLSLVVSQAKSKILDLAIRGKLVPQDPNDEPASVLLERIRAEKEELIKQGKIKRDKKESVIFRGEDNSYYLNNGTSTIDISEELAFNIPDSWYCGKLKDIVMINPRNKLDDNADVAFIPMPLIEDGYSGHHTSEIRKWKEVKTGFTHFQEGDVGVAKITPCFENRKSVIFENLNNGYGAGTTELYVFRPYGKTILPQYLLAYMKSAQFIENGKRTFAGAVGQQRVSKEYVENVYFPIPPIDEQKRIVHQLTIAFEYLNLISDALT